MKVYNKIGQEHYTIDENKEISRGGEGRIIDISNDIVAKLYLPNVKPLKEGKFNELSELKSNTFIKPEELLYDNRGNVIGFTMKKVPSNFFPLLSIFNKTFCIRENITDKTKEKIIERIVDAIKFAHNKGIVIGDLNPYNILVNEDGLVYFIDVDSYETPNFKHSGVLLEDIRDFLYNGEVNYKSDYFALSVLSFNAFTFVHPYKGVCKTIPKIGDRMIHKASILNNNSNVIVPKCYEPINNPFLINQFERIFNLGERFVIDLVNKQPVIKQTKVKTNTQITSKTDELVIHTLYLGNVLISYASKERLVILNDKKQLIIYDVSLKGTYKQITVKENYNIKDKVFVYGTSIYTLQGNILIDLSDGTEVMRFGNINKLKSTIYNNILVVVSDDTMFKFNLAGKFNNKIPYETTSVFGGRFSSFNGLYQNVSGNSVLFYEKGGLNSAILKTKVKNLYQTGNYGLIETVDNESINYKLLSIKNLQIQTYDTDFTSMRHFDFINDSILVIPGDDKLSLVRTEDMVPIVNYQCNEVSEDSVVHCTNAGITVVNQDSIYLINKK